MSSRSGEACFKLLHASCYMIAVCLLQQEAGSWGLLHIPYSGDTSTGPASRKGRSGTGSCQTEGGWTTFLQYTIVTVAVKRFFFISFFIFVIPVFLTFLTLEIIFERFYYKKNYINVTRSCLPFNRTFKLVGQCSVIKYGKKLCYLSLNFTGPFSS